MSRTSRIAEIVKKLCEEDSAFAARANVAPLESQIHSLFEHIGEISVPVLDRLIEALENSPCLFAADEGFANDDPENSRN